MSAIFVLVHLAGFSGGGTPVQEPSPPDDPDPPSSAAIIALVGVDVVPMDSELLLVDHTVVVRDRRIETIGLRGDVIVPRDAMQIDGAGLVLMPGLADSTCTWMSRISRPISPPASPRCGVCRPRCPQVGCFISNGHAMAGWRVEFACGNPDMSVPSPG